VLYADVEVIFDAAQFVDGLPETVEAVFFLDGPEVREENCRDCIAGPKEESYARIAHQTMLNHFGLTSTQLPLVSFDPWNWQTPFAADPPDRRTR
jgi:hypothetical protein